MSEWGCRVLTAMVLMSCQSTSRAPATEHPAAVSGRSGAFGWSLVAEPSTGRHVVTLAYDDPKDSRRSLQARVCPEAGANLFSLALGGMELLQQPAEFKDLPEGGAGTPILYPTPNRIRDGRFTFEGREFRFGDDAAHFIHGLVRKRPWSCDPPMFWDGALPAGRRVTHVAFESRIRFEPETPQFERFPIRHTLTVRFSLHRESLWITFGVHNEDRARLPFGFAIHPYFRLLGAREQTFLHVPAQARMEATPDLLPTGVLCPLDGSPFDLRRARPLSELALDDVYWGMSAEAPASFEARDAGVRVVLKAGEPFTHLVVFTPRDKPYFCVENQTCSTDAHNLHAKGFGKEAHLLVVEPGQTTIGAVSIRPSWIR